MASIHKNHQYWYIAYTDGDQKRHFVNSGIEDSPVGIDPKDKKKKTRTNRATAQIMAIQIEQLAQGSRRPRVVQRLAAQLLASTRQAQAQQSGMTLRAFYDDWVLGKLPKVGKSYANQLKACKTEFCTALGARADAPIIEIDEDDICDFVAVLQAQQLSGRSINKRLFMVEEMLRRAEKQAFIVVSPIEDDHYQPETPVERQAIEASQVQTLLFVVKMIDWITVILFGFYGGFRLSDAISQTWEAISFEKHVIYVVPGKTKRKHHHKAKVVVTPLHPVLYAHLRLVRTMCGASPLVTPTLARRPISNLSGDFIELLVRAGINPLPKTLPNGRIIHLLSFHSLRHAFATMLKRAGAPEKEWMTLTGHAVTWSRWDEESISQVAQIYNHVNVDDLRKWVELLPALTIQYASSPSGEDNVLDHTTDK